MDMRAITTPEHVSWAAGAAALGYAGLALAAGDYWMLVVAFDVAPLLLLGVLLRLPAAGAARAAEILGLGLGLMLAALFSGSLSWKGLLLWGVPAAIGLAAFLSETWRLRR